MCDPADPRKLNTGGQPAEKGGGEGGVADWCIISKYTLCQSIRLMMIIETI